MSQFNIADAKSRLSALVQRAMMGEEVVIARDNKPVARIVPLREERRHRRPGTARGEVWIAPDFDETPDDFKDYI